MPLGPNNCPMRTLTTLADIAGKLGHLVIACDRCGRRGQLSVARLIRERGLDCTLRAIVDEAAADCPRLINPPAGWYDLCRVMCPDCRGCWGGGEELIRC